MPKSPFANFVEPLIGRGPITEEIIRQYIEAGREIAKNPHLSESKAFLVAVLKENQKVGIEVNDIESVVCKEHEGS